MLKAREYDEDIFNKIAINELNVMAIQESNNINENSLSIFKDYVK